MIFRNPTRALASAVSELWRDPRATEDTPLCAFCDDGSAKIVTEDDTLKLMRRTTDSTGEDELGFSAKDIGTHSV